MTGFDDPDPEEPRRNTTFGSKHSEEVKRRMRDGQARWRASLPKNPNIDKVCGLWKSGKSVKDIMRSLRLCQATVYKYLKMSDIEVVRHNPPITPEDDDIIITAREKGISCASIGDALGRSVNSIASRCHTLRKHGVITIRNVYRYSTHNQPEKKKRRHWRTRNVDAEKQR